ncbi:MAG TPA: glycosyltransferase [Blastocatellia bacterium]|nr:glycosyltransferase [Blastocatellia bacterium]
MNEQPLISVIIPFLNAGPFIEEAIESVLAQTYAAWELLLADDGSSDSGTAMARRCEREYPGKVRYLEHAGHENRGLSATRNLGIRHARGEFIAFLDADDVWLPHKLERQMAILDSQPDAAMVYGPSQKWFSWTGRPADAGRDFVYDLGIPADALMQPPTLLALCLERRAITPCPTNILLRREAVERVGGFEESFRGRYQHCEDQAFLAKVYAAAPVFVSGECWDRYRQHPDSISSKTKGSGEGFYVWEFYLNWLEAYLTKHNVRDARVWKALKHELGPYRDANRSRLQKAARRSLGQVKSMLRQVARQSLPPAVRRRLRAQWQNQR